MAVKTSAQRVQGALEGAPPQRQRVQPGRAVRDESPVRDTGSDALGGGGEQPRVRAQLPQGRPFAPRLPGGVEPVQPEGEFGGLRLPGFGAEGGREVLGVEEGQQRANGPVRTAPMRAGSVPGEVAGGGLPGAGGVVAGVVPGEVRSAEEDDLAGGGLGFP
ncbi:hypothetical protein GCM10010376_24210 [Streptomyces violaceusniger]